MKKKQLLTVWYLCTRKHEYIFWRRMEAKAENDFLRDMYGKLAMDCIHNFLKRQ